MPLIQLVVRAPMPRTRAECLDGPRPCPHIRCRYHLATKILEGSQQLRVRSIPPGQDTCALDVADRGRQTLEDIGALLGITRERARQIEVAALRKLRGELEKIAGEGVSAFEAFFPEERDTDDEKSVVAEGRRGWK